MILKISPPQPLPQFVKGNSFFFSFFIKSTSQFGNICFKHKSWNCQHCHGYSIYFSHNQTAIDVWWHSIKCANFAFVFDFLFQLVHFNRYGVYYEIPEDVITIRFRGFFEYIEREKNMWINTDHLLIICSFIDRMQQISQLFFSIIWERGIYHFGMKLYLKIYIDQEGRRSSQTE